jgi:AcrR family transcriptional regulator
MRRRAEQVDGTRQQITEAAVRLHTSAGPAHTTISGVAAEAGVTRLTVYRHFPDLDALFMACMGHWSAQNPIPDIDAWQIIEPLEARARFAFEELFRWYDGRHAELYPIYRDETAMPDSARQGLRAQFDAIAAAISSPGQARSDANDRILVAVTRHLVDYWTWHSLVIERGLEVSVATEAAVSMLLAVDR